MKVSLCVICNFLIIEFKVDAYEFYFQISLQK